MTAPSDLVARKVDAPVDRFAGVWIIEDIQTIEAGVRDKSWIEGTLGVVGASLDSLALVSDPAGALLQYGIAWLIEHIRPLREALDALAGDAAQIKAHAQTWTNVGNALIMAAGDLEAAVRRDLEQWHGETADAYRAWAKDEKAILEGLAKGATTMSTITTAAGILVATVRMLVRDAIATVVSRLIVYAAELIASFGLLTPLVYEQVTTLVSAWTAKIARWMHGLTASLRRLQSTVSRLMELIGKLRQMLRERLHGGHEPHDPHEPTREAPKPRTERQELLDELAKQGIKHNPDEILHIGRDATGKIVFLEKGNSRAGLQHILERHADDFAKAGVPRDHIADLVFEAVTKGKVVGSQRGREIYEVVFNGETRRLAVSTGTNGFIVGANPVSRGL